MLKISKQNISSLLKKCRPDELQYIAHYIKNLLASENANIIIQKSVELTNSGQASLAALVKSSKAKPHELRNQMKDIYYWLSYPKTPLLNSIHLYWIIH